MHGTGLFRTIAILLVATTLEVCGDAVVRTAIHGQGTATAARIGLFALGAALVFGYATFLNLAPIEFGRVVGLYIATLLVVWQIVSLVVFREVPTLPVLLGGALIVAGGAIVSFVKA